MKSKDELTTKQEGFAQDIACYKYDFDYEAYKAHYSTKNMNMDSIYRATCALIQLPKVSARIKEIRKNAMSRADVTLDEVLKELANWLRFDPLEIIDPDSEALLPLKDMPKKARMSLAEIHVQEIFGNIEDVDGKKKREKIGELKKIKFIDKRAVADQFMKKFGAYVQDNSETSNYLEAIKEIVNSLTNDK